MSRRANTLRLNRAHRRIAGVCAGIADYLEAPAFLLRLIYVLACLVWPTMIIAYPLAWWWMKNREEKGSDFLSGSKVANHLRGVDYRQSLYRSRANRRIAGVCGGIADYLQTGATTIRVLTLLSFFIFGPLTFFAYMVLWIALEKNPAQVGHRRSCRRSGRRHSRRERRMHRHARRSMTDDDMTYAEYDPQHDDINEFSGEPEPEYNDENEHESITMSLQECAAAFNTVESRLRDVEAFITSKRFRLHCEINRI